MCRVLPIEEQPLPPWKVICWWQFPYQGAEAPNEVHFIDYIALSSFIFNYKRNLIKTCCLHPDCKIKHIRY